MLHDGLPSVGVVIPTRDRPELLAKAIDAVMGQDYGGSIRVVVVYDQAEPDFSLAMARNAAGRTVDVVANQRRPGLAGARNTGILELETSLVGFCDDDDEWLPGKLAAQVAALDARPTAEFASCSIMVDFKGSSSDRLAGTELVTQDDLFRSRMSMLHSSTFLFRRTVMVDGIGLVDEDIPGAQNEDWDLVLRAAGRQPIVHVDRPLVRIRWGSTSYFARQWETKISSLEWMLRRHPGISAHPVGAARVYGQIAFAYATLGDRPTARRWAIKSLRRRLWEWRAVAALVVATRVVTGEAVLRRLHRYGRGV